MGEKECLESGIMFPTLGRPKKRRLYKVLKGLLAGRVMVKAANMWAVTGYFCWTFLPRYFAPPLKVNCKGRYSVGEGMSMLRKSLWYLLIVER